MTGRLAAAIDIGTNSVRLLVALKSAGGGLKTLQREQIITRLGERIGGGVLLPAAMARTAEAVGRLCRTAARHGALHPVVAATSAVRDASNRDEFLDLVQRRTGLAVQVLSGEEEALLSYRGALAGLSFGRSGTAVVDVGGGSTELIWSEPAGGRLNAVSVNVGAVRCTEAGSGEEEVAGILRPVLQQVRDARVERLAGVGGTVTTMAAVDQGLAEYDPALVHGYKLTRGRVEDLHRMLSAMEPEQRRRVPGLQPERSDIIVAGIVIIKTVLEGLGLTCLIVSECDILDGLVLKEAEK